MKKNPYTKIAFTHTEENTLTHITSVVKTCNINNNKTKKWIENKLKEKPLESGSFILKKTKKQKTN